MTVTIESLRQECKDLAKKVTKQSENLPAFPLGSEYTLATGTREMLDSLARGDHLKKFMRS